MLHSTVIHGGVLLRGSRSWVEYNINPNEFTAQDNNSLHEHVSPHGPSINTQGQMNNEKFLQNQNTLSNEQIHEQQLARIIFVLPLLFPDENSMRDRHMI